MLKNYLLVALRNLWREKTYAAINLISLSFAIACCLILAIYLRSELTYDQHHINHNRIYKIAVDYTNNGNTTRYGVTPQALGPLFLKEYPHVGEYVRFRDSNDNFIDNRLFRSEDEDREFYWDDVMVADDNVFDVFTHEVIYGDLEGALVDPYSIVLSQSFSQAYFGDQNPVGRTLSTDSATYTVTGVFKDFPSNVHLKYSALLSMNLMDTIEQGDETMTPASLYVVRADTYLHVDPAISQPELQRLFNDFHTNVMGEEAETREITMVFHPLPLLDVHFDNRFIRGPATGNIFYVYGFIAVALFILLVACINYTNLATARGIKRAKEVGMRKILGAGRGQLVAQFIGESVFYALLALVFGIILVELVEQYTPLASWLDQNYLLRLTTETGLIGWALAGTLAVGILAGAYPAFYLSFIEPLAAVTSSKRPQASASKLRQFLTFIQFLVSVSVVACTLLMLVQMEYVTNRSLGYENDNKIAVRLRGADAISRVPVISNELLTYSGVVGVTETSFVPGIIPPNITVTFEGNDGQPERRSIGFRYAGTDFIDVMGIEMAEGRDFSEILPSAHRNSAIVNETLARLMEWDDSVGKQVLSLERTVIGVMKDFHAASLHTPIEPLIILPFPESRSSNARTLSIESRDLVISIAEADITGSLRHIESVMNRFDSAHPFEFRFFDEILNVQYQNENRLMRLTGIFAAICIIISCLGLFGLSALSTQQRTKEIGVRKVLGASTMQIVMLLAKFQLLMVVVASSVASFGAYAMMNNWMANFTYRTEIPIWPFVISTLVVALAAFLTIALQSIKTAQTNPVKTLRYE